MLQLLVSTLDQFVGQAGAVELVCELPAFVN
jgi:hypothetical protein